MSDFPLNWDVVAAEDFCSSVRDGTHDSPKFLDHGHPLVTSKNIKGGNIDLSTAALISVADFDEINRRSKVDRWDVLFSMIGTVGEVCLVDASVVEFAIKNVGLFKCDSEEDGRWLSLWLRSPAAKSYVAERLRGASQQYIPLSELRKFPVPVPKDRGEKRRITTALSVYDDLIAINQRRIALLEDAARSLYREWFVHLRFPGYESVPVKDGVPEGWVKLPLGDVAEITMGQSPESKYYNTDGDGLPFHQGVSDFGHRFVTHETYTKLATRVAEAGDILCSVRAPVGRLNLTRDKIAIGRGLSAMRSCADHQSLLFYQLDSLFVEEDMIGGGAIFASVGKKELFGQQILQPSAAIAATFNRLAADIDAQIENLDSQNRDLAKARDLLLPKLMSGQLDVSGIRLPEEAAA
jgi:type I restriction enzyme S subunit